MKVERRLLVVDPARGFGWLMRVRRSDGAIGGEQRSSLGVVGTVGHGSEVGDGTATKLGTGRRRECELA